MEPKRKEGIIICNNAVLFVFGLLSLIIGIVMVFVGAAKIHSADEDCSTQAPSTAESIASPQSPSCDFSSEAVGVGLPRLLEEVKTAYFLHTPNKAAWNPDMTKESEKEQYMKTRYRPYDPSPEVLKRKTDAALALLEKLKKTKVDERKLKAREAKALWQAKHFLQHVFGSPFDVNYYAGDWLMGPNYFCWQPICSVPYDLNSFAWYVKPRSYNDVQLVIDIIMMHKNTFDQYRNNIAMGVKAGMVRSDIDCRAGLDAIKETYPKIAQSNASTGVLHEWYVAQYLKSQYLERLNSKVDDLWKTKHSGQSVQEAIKEALVKGFGEPVLSLIHYLEYEHSRHCLPIKVASGLANLPVDYVYTDGDPDVKNKTKKVLPGTARELNGTKTYSMILSYFTTTNISAETIYQEGRKQLKTLMPQVYKIAKLLTGRNKRSKAIEEFKILLNGPEQWHNSAPFPANESDERAHQACRDPDSAKKNCPRRWAAVVKWGEYINEVMSMIAPKIRSMFYFSGPKITAPNCPIQMWPHYNPSNGAMYFRSSDSNCTTPCHFGLPFFLKEYGPKFQEWSVIGHESRPGHHTQMQGLIEHFRDRCGGVPRWLDKQTSYVAFQEGWALYAESPLLSRDARLYEENFLQLYGMKKWQVWRAVRLVVDTGLHYRGMTRSEALKYFENSTWDTTDFAVKEVTRYQSVPGQATAYMLGKLALMDMRTKVEKELKKSFNLRDFHYHLLSQGSAPLGYLQNHIDKYIDCEKKKIEPKYCADILRYSDELSDEEQVSKKEIEFEEKQPPKPPHRSYV